MEVFGIFQLLLSLSPDPTTNSEIPIPNFFKYGHDFADKKENKKREKMDNSLSFWQPDDLMIKFGATQKSRQIGHPTVFQWRLDYLS